MMQGVYGSAARTADFEKLNQRITILEHRTVVDEIGNHITKWDEVYSCWANVTVKSSAENTNTGITKEVQSVSFVVRQSLFGFGKNQLAVHTL